MCIYVNMHLSFRDSVRENNKEIIRKLIRENKLCGRSEDRMIKS